MRFRIGVILLFYFFSRPAAASPSFPAGIEINRVDINGVHVFNSQALEGTLEVGPGDHLERPRVVRTEENIQRLYQAHGYEDVGVQSRLTRKKNPRGGFETVLEFDVHEGNPVRISSILLAPEGVLDERSKKLWNDRQAQIKKSLGVDIGDIFDQEKLGEGKRAVQELLASDEYIGPKVSSVRVISSNQPEGISGQIPASRWVALEIHVDLGDRVIFGYKGNTFFTKGYLNGIVNEQRLLGLGQDYIKAIRTRLEEEYRWAGFARVEITPYTMESQKGGYANSYERKVVYDIQEGPRVQIEQIDFDGNIIFNDNELREQFLSQASTLIQHGIYVERDIQKAAESLVDKIKAKGYLSAKLVTINTVYPPRPRTQVANGKVHILIYLYEGDQTLVQSLSISGNTVFSTEEIKAILKMNPGEPLNLFAFNEGIEALKAKYKERGYLDFKIVNEGTDTLVQYSQENRIAQINLQLDEDEQFKVSEIEVEGLGRTHEDVVRRELVFHKDEVLTTPQMNQSEQKLRRLGIFSEVNLHLIDDPEKKSYKIVRVTVRESDRGILTWGPGLRNDLGIRLFGQLSYTNLWGRNHTVSITANANRRINKTYQFGEGQFQVAYAWPWFLIPDLTFRPVASIGRTQYINLSADTLTLAATWEKMLVTQPNITGSVTYTLESIRQFNAVDTVKDEGRFRIGTVTPRVSLDLRDSPLSPTSGLFATGWMDVATPILGSQADPYPIGYYRAQFRTDYYVPLWTGAIWYFSFRTGYEQSLEKTLASGATAIDQFQDAIPLIKQFALGGIGSVRGFTEQEINYQSVSVRGSLSYVNYRTQVDLPFAGALRFGVFLDAANLLIDRFSFGELMYGAGFGFHYLTPVGAVNLDWGFKLNPLPNVDTNVIHFSVGVI